MSNASEFAWVSAEKWQSLRWRRVSELQREAERAKRSKLPADFHEELDCVAPVAEIEPVPLSPEFEPWLQRRVRDWNWGRLTEEEVVADGMVLYGPADARTLLDRAARVARAWSSRQRWSAAEWQRQLKRLAVSTGYLSVGATLSPEQRTEVERHTSAFEREVGPLLLASFREREEALAELGTAWMLAQFRLKSARRAGSESTEDLAELIAGLATTGGGSWAPEVYGGVEAWLRASLESLAAEGEFETVWIAADGTLLPQVRALSLLAFLWMEVIRLWNLAPNCRMCSGCQTWFEHPDRRVKLCAGCRTPAAKMRRQRADRRRQREVAPKRNKGEGA